MPDVVKPIPVEMLDIGNTERAKSDYTDIIEAKIRKHPRSQQKEIGPSEVGCPCDRRIGYTLLQYSEPDKINWKAEVGTAVHSYLEDAFQDYNLAHAEFASQERYLTENQIMISNVPYLGYPLGGHCDLYDRVTGTVIDHKTTSMRRLKNYRRDGPGQQYRIQANLYGFGWRQAGFAVENVAIAFLPRDGEWWESFFWSEPYDEKVALDALARLSGIAQITSMGGKAALRLLQTGDAFCGFCPFYKPGSDDPVVGCPGHPGSVANRATQAAAHTVAGDNVIFDVIAS